MILRGVVLRGRRGRGGGDWLVLEMFGLFGLFGFVDVDLGAAEGCVSGGT